MDLTSRSASARLRAGPPLVRWLRQRREQGLGGEPARRVRPRWACLDAALGMAARQAARRLRFPVLLRGELPYPWSRTRMEYVPGAGRRPSLSPAGASAAETDAPRGEDHPFLSWRIP